MALEEKLPGTYESVSKVDSYVLGDYTAVDDAKVAALGDEKSAEVGEVVKAAKQGALMKVTVFPFFMLICYIGLILYFKARGGYKAVDAHGMEHAEEEQAAPQA